jgi:hypothetical protein
MFGLPYFKLDQNDTPAQKTEKIRIMTGIDLGFEAKKRFQT